MNAKTVIAFAMKWSNGDPELCAEIAVDLSDLLQREREACAEIVDNMTPFFPLSHKLKAAILARE